MKHGKKQLYSQYRKTLKRNNDFESERKENVLATPIKIEMDNNEPKPDFSIRQNKLNELNREAFERVISKLNPNVAYVDAADVNVVTDQYIVDRVNHDVK